MAVVTLDTYLHKQLRNPAFKKEWDKLEVQSQVTRALIRARLDRGISQRTLARKARTTQAVISRIESMSVSPTVGLLERIANALNKKLEIRFI